MDRRYHDFVKEVNSDFALSLQYSNSWALETVNLCILAF